jgi:hypothetical protein
MTSASRFSCSCAFAGNTNEDTKPMNNASRIRVMIVSPQQYGSIGSHEA